MRKMEKILVVDDDQSILKVVKMRLEAEEYNVEVATDGDRATSAMKNDTFDLALMDLKLAGENGIEVMESLPWIVSAPCPGSRPASCRQREDSAASAGTAVNRFTLAAAGPREAQVLTVLHPGLDPVTLADAERLVAHLGAVSAEDLSSLPT